MAEDRHENRRGPLRRFAAAAVVVALVAAAIGAATWRGQAASLYEAAGSPGPRAARLEQARRAAGMEPWNDRFAWRLLALRGRRLLEAGRVDDAYRLLEPYSTIVRGDPVYRRVYQAVVRVKAPLDARKAHLQHAREQTGGVLLEEDVFK